MASLYVPHCTNYLSMVTKKACPEELRREKRIQKQSVPLGCLLDEEQPSKIGSLGCKRNIEEEIW